MGIFNRLLNVARTWEPWDKIPQKIENLISSDFSSSDSLPNKKVFGSGRYGEAIFKLCIYYFKTKGGYSKEEMQIMQLFFVDNFGESYTTSYFNQFDKTWKSEFSIIQIAAFLERRVDYKSRLHVINLIYKMAAADFKIDKEEFDLLDLIAIFLGITASDRDGFLQMYQRYIDAELLKNKRTYNDASSGQQQQQNQYQQQNQNQQRSGKSKTPSNYEILGISPTATNDEIKKAYRRLAVMHHPDKYTHLGEEHQKAANQRFLVIQKAYEAIKKERGFK